MIDEMKRHLQYFTVKCNDLSISLFSARQEITSLRGTCAHNQETIERLVSEKNLLSEKLFRLQAELQKLRTGESSSVDNDIQNLLFSANLYLGD